MKKIDETALARMPRDDDETTEEPRQSADPRQVLISMLESDQLVSYKQGTHFGRRQLVPWLRVMLWALRIYVLLMLVVVVIQILQSAHS